MAVFEHISSTKHLKWIFIPHSELGKERVNLILGAFIPYALLDMGNRYLEQTGHGTQINPVSAAVVLDPPCHKKNAQEFKNDFRSFSWSEQCVPVSLRCLQGRAGRQGHPRAVLCPALCVTWPLVTLAQGASLRLPHIWLYKVIFVWLFPIETQKEGGALTCCQFFLN